MPPKHDNPTKFRNDNYAYGFWARAPYNFVPLPEAIITVDKSEIPGHDSYDHQFDTYTGAIECTLVTEAPLYTRAALNPDFFRKLSKKAAELSDEEKEKLAPFFSLDGGKTPVIPGSSLRGMVRSLVEIMSFSKVHFVGDKPKFTFRAVAAGNRDPLGKIYNQWMKHGQNVKAGYLARDGEDWYIHPALRPEDIGWPNEDQRSFIPVRRDAERYVRGLIPFGSRQFRPQFLKVSFEIDLSRRRPFVKVSDNLRRFSHKGMLIASGDMLETGRASGGRSPRRKYALIPSQDTSKSRKKIPPQVVEDYLDSLTDFQKSSPFGPFGVLKNGNPVFYVERRGKVAWIGHTPNFRIPAWKEDEHRAVTPQDMIPDELKSLISVDITEAIFGYVARGSGDDADPGRAGRVFFTDAAFVGAESEIWFTPKPATPKVLSTPKPTTFQHYLVQDRSQGHDPDEKETLAHWATSSNETAIRGHKLYWHKGEDFQSDDFIEKDDNRIRRLSSQYTRIEPVAQGVTFSFRVHFENLRDWELGALLWALKLPVDDGRDYRHKLGMAKPLGLGTVRITVDKVHLSDRDQRYRHLFASDEDHDLAWFETVRDEKDFVQAFEDYIWTHLSEEDKKGAQSFREVERIRMLLEMMKWPGPDSELTRYMEIQYPDERLDRVTHNEFKERPVLPHPDRIDEVDYFRGLETDMEVQTRVHKIHEPRFREGSDRNPHTGLTVEIEQHPHMGHINKQGLDHELREGERLRGQFEREQPLRSWVLYLQNQPKRIGLTLRRPHAPKVWRPPVADHADDGPNALQSAEPEDWQPAPLVDPQPGDEVEGVILAIENNRLSVNIGATIDASLTYREIPDVRDQDEATKKFKVGQRIKAKLLKRARRGRWQLTMR